MSQRRRAVFVDGMAAYYTAKSLGFEIDFKKLRKWLAEDADLLRVSYYTTMPEEAEHVSVRPLVDWLDYNGYRVVTKTAKEFVDASGRRKVKGGMEVELVVDAVETAPHVDEIMLFAGDGDYRAMVKAVQRLGARVVVVSTIAVSPPLVADELRRQADEFLDMKEVAARIGRDPADQRPRPDRPRQAGVGRQG